MRFGLKQIKKITEVSLENKKVFIRSDLNVPLDDSQNVIDTTRIEASVETIQYAISKNATVFLTSHLGRPQEGVFDVRYSLRPIVVILERILKKKFLLLKIGLAMN